MYGKSDLYWKVFPERPENEKELSAGLHIDPLIARILINRGINSVEDSEKFLNVSLEDLHSPFLMSGMERAVERISRAIKEGEKVMIFGDYDVDGISATSLLFTFFRQLGLDVSYYIPHRVEEGYGLNVDAIKKFAREKYTLLITVDCGVTSVEEVEKASELGIDVIITDHHQVSQKLPPALALLNPAMPECKYPFKHLAGVGIAYKLISAIKTSLIESGKISAKDSPNLNRVLDLVALGTLADMVPLIGENHVLVKIGLEEMTKTRNVGLRALINLGNFSSKPIADVDIGFFIAPRLNAIGRLQNARLGVDLLTTDDKFVAREIAKKLEIENAKRQNIQNRILKEALSLIEREVDLENDKAIVFASKGWHPGVIGIVASKLVERFHLPTILLDIGDGAYRGSARSIPGFHIYECLAKCSDRLLYFGGHKYAAGLSLKESMMESFKAEFKKIAAESLSSKVIKPVLEIDSVVPLNRFNLNVVEDILELGPFGPQNPYPIFLARDVRFTEKPFFVGRENEHVKFEVELKNFRMDGIAYGMSRRFQGVDCTRGSFDIVFTPTIIARGGMSKTVQVKLHDFVASA